VCQLSETLRSVAQGQGHEIDDKYRNTAGCFMKLRQFQNIDQPPSGLKNHSKTDREIFNRYANDDIGLRLAVAAARKGRAFQTKPSHFSPGALDEWRRWAAGVTPSAHYRGVSWLSRSPFRTSRCPRSFTFACASVFSQPCKLPIRSGRS
jgi:hypothetical protein